MPARVKVAALHLVVRDLPREQAPHVLEVGREVVGVGDLLQGLGEQLLGGVPGDRQQRLVDAYPAALGGQQRDPDGGVLEEQLEALLGVAAGLLGVLRRGVMSRETATPPTTSAAMPPRSGPTSTW